MRQLELTHVHNLSRRRKPLVAPPPEQLLADDVAREVVRLMALALLAVLRSDGEKEVGDDQ